MKKVITTALLFGGLILASFAQNVETLQVFMKPVDAEGNSLQTRDRAVLTDPATNLQVTYAIKTSGEVVKLHVKLGTTVGGNEKATFTINADGSNLPAGVTYNKQGEVIYLEIGYYNGIQQYYAEAIAEDANGNQSAPAEQSTIQ